MAIRSLKSGSFSRSAQVGNSIILPGDYESIATTTVSNTSTTTVTFSSIPSTFTHLQIRVSAGTDNADANIIARFNSDSATNYSVHYLYGDGASAGAGAEINKSSFTAAFVAPNIASTFGAGVVDILDYANTNKYKTIRSLTGYDKNASGNLLVFYSGSWRSTAAISSISLISQGGNYKQNSHVALYGIRG